MSDSTKAEKVTITFIESNGERKNVTATIGDSIMAVATTNLISGIDGDCGGACACGTCRVFGDGPLAALIGTPDDMEEGLLDFVADGDSSQRLGCQINITADFEGAEIRVVV